MEAKTNGANGQGDECVGAMQVLYSITHPLGNISSDQSSLCTVTVDKCSFWPQVMTDFKINPLTATSDHARPVIDAGQYLRFLRGLMKATASKRQTPASACIASLYHLPESIHHCKNALGRTGNTLCGVPLIQYARRATGV